MTSTLQGEENVTRWLFLIKNFQQMTFDINPGLNMHCRREFIYVAHIYITDELSKSFAFVAHFFTEGDAGGDRPAAHTTKHPMLWQGELNRPIIYIFDYI